ncbi:hypothetical protein ACWEPL_09400 [Nonomuraea sp. NPDC004186]
MKTRRTTGQVALIMSIGATSLPGLAPPATAADRDFILTLNASDLGMDPADPRGIVPEMQADITEHGGLGPAIKQTLADNQGGATIDTSEWPNFDGTVNVTSDNAGRGGHHLLVLEDDCRRGDRLDHGVRTGSGRCASRPWWPAGWAPQPIR